MQNGIPGFARSMDCCMHLAHMGDMNLSRPSAAMETFMYIQAQLMVWRLLKQAIPDQLVTKNCKNQAEINSTLWTYMAMAMGSWSYRPCAYEGYGEKMSQMAHV